MALPTCQWGDPTATKHALLLHGITRSSHVWHRVARDLASRGTYPGYFAAQTLTSTTLGATGYHVTAPDLPGHGNAPRARHYTISALAEALRPLLTAPGAAYDIVIGHSLGGVIASALLPLLASARPVHVVLIDPPLYATPEAARYSRKLFGDMVRHPTTPEACLKENPKWTKEEATMACLSVRACDVAAVEAILDQNDPWSFAHYLAAVPENVNVTVLAADPAEGAAVHEDEVKMYPRVTARTVLGTSHWIQCEVPEVVVEAALGGTVEMWTM